MPHHWIEKPSDLTLCLSGYPIRLRLRTGREQPYTLEFDGRPDRHFSGLAQAKTEALISAAEWDLLIARALAD
ncbi:hypothetical protein [Teichococcus vastitatis]|uniref:Uncharacterized protein n=1 Tax=Teichococcus vastitatis TaxID=2307076 RepID=A0ABS9W4I8_9PROT|nr:hypothetical protein [Pseudoroseomonas vastitatis]MCI0754201.1 hypothetical protein [Pseudoroseomonas vastitatis]